VGAGAARRLTALALGGALLWAGALASAGAAEHPRWLLSPTPNPAGPVDSELFGVSCTSASECMAVGYSDDGSGVRSLLAERYAAGRWHLAAVAAPPDAVTADFVGVSCTSARACVAAGNYRVRSGLTRTLAERWDGASWRIDATVNPGHPYGQPTLDAGTEFSGVSCASARSCVAVGDYLDTRHRSVSLIERFDGSRWSLEHAPAPFERPLGSASCASAAACTVVGERRRGFGVLLPIAERSAGSSWKLQQAPASRVPGSKTNILVSVSCASGDACAAVGERSTAAGAQTPFVERFAGGRWSIQPTPRKADAALGGVSCPAGGACTAVGIDNDAAGRRTLPLIEHWDGRSWALQASAALARGRVAGGLAAVSCVTASLCVAVGFATYTAGGVARTLTLAERRG
jgi:hypothetical protein